MIIIISENGLTGQEACLLPIVCIGLERQYKI